MLLARGEESQDPHFGVLFRGKGVPNVYCLVLSIKGSEM